jgi:3-oxoacyl-[acyl-carrier-protein] synthase II
MILAAVHLALDDAGLSRQNFALCNSAIVIGVSLIDMEMTEKEFRSFKETGLLSPSTLASANPHAPATHVARELHCNGKVITYAGTCSSGLISISTGAEMILRGEADVVLAGGGDSCITPFVVSGFTVAGLHPASFGEDPTAECRPFDEASEGGVLAEGAGIVVLESAEHARQRGAHVYAGVTGWGSANATSLMSSRDAFASAMEQALAKAGIAPGMIDYVSAHAPGIKLSDRLEVAAIKRVFGHQAYNLAVSSIKSMIGNPLAASGPLQVIAAVQSMKHSFLPPTINLNNPDTGCDLDFVPHLGRIARVATAMINSSGIGGCIASLILAKPQ